MNETPFDRGIVTRADPGTGKVKVRFDALDRRADVATPSESPWLAVLVPRGRGNRKVDLPQKDDQVLVLWEPGFETGYVLGGFYSRADPPPTLPSPTAWFRDFPDGTTIFHDPENGLTKVEGPGDLQAIMGGDARVEAGGSATVKGATITLDGPVTVTGTLHVQGVATFDENIAQASGKNIPAHHTHPVTGTTATRVE